MKRLLDGRGGIPFAYGGQGRFHTTLTEPIAAAALHAANGGGPPVINVVDPEAPSAAEIAWAILDAMGLEAELVGLPDERYPPTAGVTPWSVPLLLASASASGHAPVGSGREFVPTAIRWLVEATRGRDWRAVLPVLAAYPRDLFDDDADDRAVARPGAERLGR